MHGCLLLAMTTLAGIPGEPVRDRSGVDQPLAVLEFEALVDAPRGDVFQAWTTDAGVRRFFAPDCRVELEIGGPYQIYFLPDNPEGQRGADTCRVLSYVPGEMLSFDWNAPMHFAHARPRHTWVVIQFFDHGADQTRLRFRHFGF